MHQSITGYHQDDEGHWVAQLTCGHNQHVRYDPPMMTRPWVTTEQGRAEMLGQSLNCLKCDRGEPIDTRPIAIGQALPPKQLSRLDRKPRAIGILFFQAAVLFGAINGLIGTCLILFIDVESVVVTGPIEAVLGSLTLGFAIAYRHSAGMILGVSMIGISLLFFLLVLTLGWSPSDAEMPFSIMSGFYLLFSLPLAGYVLYRPPISRQEWQCQRCGYPIVGLTQPTCPECGSAIDPTLIEIYAHAAVPQ